MSRTKMLGFSTRFFFENSLMPFSTAKNLGSKLSAQVGKAGSSITVSSHVNKSLRLIFKKLSKFG